MESSLPMAGRLTAVGALLTPTPIALDTIDPAFREHQQQLANLVANQKLQSQTYSLTALPVSIVTDTPVKDISRQKTVPAKVVVEQVVSPEKNKVTPAMTKNPQQVNVVQAKKTGRPGVYSVEIAPGKPALQIGMTDKKPSKSFKTPSYDDVKPESVIPSVTSETYQGIVDFGGDHAPIYISISKNLTAEEEKKQAETAKIDWEIYNPIEAAEVNLALASKEYDDAVNQVSVKQKALEMAKKTPEALAFVDAKLYPYNINIKNNGIGFSDVIDSKEKMSFLLTRGARAYVWDYLGLSHIEAPTKEGLNFAVSVRNEILNIFEEIRKQILQGQQSIKDAENNLVLAKKIKIKQKIKRKKRRIKKKRKKSVKSREPLRVKVRKSAINGFMMPAKTMVFRSLNRLPIN
nr:colicin-like bacteriocin tRNase domain-containing protein [Providencia stuartii]